MEHRSRTSAVLAAMAALALVTGGGPGMRTFAAEPAKEGRIAVTISQSGSWEGFEIGHRHWVWIARRTGTFEGTGILDGMTSNCVSKGKTLFGVSEAAVHCENIDADGDKIYESSTETGVWTRGGKGGTGSGMFIGGTGKYARIRGTFEIVRKVGPRDEAARTWTDYVTITGNWTLR